jgi:hypothetical protein
MKESAKVHELEAALKEVVKEIGISETKIQSVS